VAARGRLGDKNEEDRTKKESAYASLIPDGSFFLKGHPSEEWGQERGTRKKLGIGLTIIVRPKRVGGKNILS